MSATVPRYTMQAEIVPTTFMRWHINGTFSKLSDLGVALVSRINFFGFYDLHSRGCCSRCCICILQTRAAHYSGSSGSRRACCKM
jgi:hypothetical protein